MVNRIVLNIILAVVVFLLTVVIIMILVRPIFSYNPNKPENYVETPTTEKVSTYDHTSYILSKTPINLLTYNECDKLKEAVKNAIVTGKPYEVGDIAYGSSLGGEVGFPMIGDCPPSTITTHISGGLNQTVCSFETITSNSVSEIETYGGISDSAGLSYDDCDYKYISGAYSALYGILNVMGPSAEEVNLNPNTINIYYSPDYLYFKNGDYVHNPSMAAMPQFYSDLVNVTAFQDTAKNGPGRLKIYVGNATAIDGKCKFNVYMCPRQAIATSNEDKTIEVFDYMRELPTFGMIQMPFYIRNMSDLIDPMSDYSRDALYWNFYDITLDKDYSVDAIVNSVKGGLQISALSKGFFAQPHWNVSKDPRISMYYTSGDVVVNLAVRQGFGTVCAKMSGKADQCTSSYMVARFSKEDLKTKMVTFNATARTGNTFMRLERDGYQVFYSTLGPMSVQNDMYVHAYFDGNTMTSHDIIDFISVREGRGQICAETSTKPKTCTYTSMPVIFDDNELVTLSVIPDTANGYKFLLLDGIGGGETTNNPVSFRANVNNSFIYATFSNNKNGECWSTGYDSEMKSSSPWDRTRSIRFNCGDDNICNDTLRIKVAVRRDFRGDVDWDADGKNEELDYLSTIVSFCDT
jgi:hypothetical protein